MLTEPQKQKFNTRKYGIIFKNNGYSHDIDYADFGTITEKYQGNDIVISGWMSPHEDLECGHDEIWTFQVLAVRNEDYPVLVHTHSDGSIVGNAIAEGGIYSFLYKRTHALIPKSVALDVIDSQDWNVVSLKQWENIRKVEGYSENAIMAWYFFETKPADMFKSY